MNHMMIGTMNRRIRATPRSVGEAYAAAFSENEARTTTTIATNPADDHPEEEHAEHAEDDRNATHQPVAGDIWLTTQPPRVRGAHGHPDHDRERPGEARERTDDADRCGDEQVDAPAERRIGGRHWSGRSLPSHAENVARALRADIRQSSRSVISHPPHRRVIASGSR